MSIYKKISYRQASEEVRQVYDEVISTFALDNQHEIPNLILYLGDNPDMLKATWSLIKAGILETPHISELLRELLVVTISRAQGSVYCEAMHYCNLLKLAMFSYDELEHILALDPSDSLPEQEQVLLAAVKTLANTDCKYTSQDISKLTEQGCSKAQVLDTINLYNTVTYLNNFTIVANLPIDQTVVEFLRKQGIATPRHWWNRQLARGLEFSG